MGPRSLASNFRPTGSSSALRTIADCAPLDDFFYCGSRNADMAAEAYKTNSAFADEPFYETDRDIEFDSRFGLGEKRVGLGHSGTHGAPHDWQWE